MRLTSDFIPILQNLGLMNQSLITRSLDLGLVQEAKMLGNIDKQLAHWLMQSKQAETGMQYIWRTQEDDRVRSSHAANNGKIFSFDDPPSTGNPGEDFGCRCWAEPIKTPLQEEENQEFRFH